MASCRGQAAAWGGSPGGPSLLPTLNRGAQPCPLPGKHPEESSGQRAKVRLRESPKHPFTTVRGGNGASGKGRLKHMPDGPKGSLLLSAVADSLDRRSGPRAGHLGTVPAPAAQIK